jgi:hypothetical protein
MKGKETKSQTGFVPSRPPSKKKERQSAHYQNRTDAIDNLVNYVMAGIGILHLIITSDALYH